MTQTTMGMELIVTAALGQAAPAGGGGSAPTASAPPIAGRGESAAPATGTVDPAGKPLGTGPAGGQPPSPMGGTGFLFVIGLVFLLMILMQVFAGRKEKKRREALLSSLRRHDRVQTIGGVIGSIAEVRDDEVVLKVDEATNTKIRVARSAVTTVLKKAESRGVEEPATAGAESAR